MNEALKLRGDLMRMLPPWSWTIEYATSVPSPLLCDVFRREERIEDQIAVHSTEAEQIARHRAVGEQSPVPIEPPHEQL